MRRSFALRVSSAMPDLPDQGGNIRILGRCSGLTETEQMRGYWFLRRQSVLDWRPNCSSVYVDAHDCEAAAPRQRTRSINPTLKVRLD